MRFSMQEAISSSLFIITVNSFMGFAADQTSFNHSDWINLVIYISISIMGMVLGIFISKFTKKLNLKKLFGYFIWIIAI